MVSRDEKLGVITERMFATLDAITEETFDEARILTRLVGNIRMRFAMLVATTATMSVVETAAGISTVADAALDTILSQRIFIRTVSSVDDTNRKTN